LDPDVWNQYDIPFVEQLVAEFHERDKTGFNFRYAENDGDFCLFDHRTLARIVDHVAEILGGINTCLFAAHEQNHAYEEYKKRDVYVEEGLGDYYL